jgi:hypothetical protein
MIVQHGNEVFGRAALCDMIVSCVDDELTRPALYQLGTPRPGIRAYTIETPPAFFPGGRFAFEFW